MACSLSEEIKDQSHNAQNRSSSEMTSFILETYNCYVIPHGRYIYQTASGMSMDTMCTYPSSQHALPHWKYVLCCCSNCDIPSQESDKNHSKIFPGISFNTYKMVLHYTVHG